jgi:hypothetical protein
MYSYFDHHYFLRNSLLIHLHSFHLSYGQIFLSEERSVWRGVAPSVQVKNKATFYRGDGGAGGSTSSSALVFPAGQSGGASWTVIAPTATGRASDAVC